MARVIEAALVAVLVVGWGPGAAAQGSGEGARVKMPSRVKAAPASAPDSTVVNDFMSYDAAGKTVSLQLIAAYNSHNGGMNFNGGARGDATITVPEGWTVRAHFKNVDAIPHSAIVIPDKFPLPAEPETPSFPGAYTRDVTGGLPNGGTDEMRFKTSTAGKYLIVCGVPGHAPGGMWIHFEVSADAKAPSYKM